MDALQFNKAVSQHCKESGGDCCKCDLRLYCYIYLNDWTCYVMEQTEPNTVDKYHYELVFYPERIIPDIEIK